MTLNGCGKRRAKGEARKEARSATARAGRLDRGRRACGRTMRGISSLRVSKLRMKVRIALALAAVASVVVLTACSDKTTGSTQTLTFTEKDKTSQFNPIGNPTRKSTPPGSGFSLSIPLYDSSNKAAGELNAVCLATEPSPERTLKGTCTGTASVPEGQLAVNVGGDVGGDVTGSIVGGNGKYDGATGTFTSKSSGEGSEDTFNITLP